MTKTGGMRDGERKKENHLFSSFFLFPFVVWITGRRESGAEKLARNILLFFFFSFFLFFKTNDEVVKLEYAVQSEIEHILGLPMTTAESNDSR